MSKKAYTIQADTHDSEGNLAAAGALVDTMEATVKTVSLSSGAALLAFCQFLLNPEVRQRVLARGDDTLKPIAEAKSAKGLAGLLEGMDDENLRELGEELKRALSGVVVKKVRLPDFHPTVETVSRREVEAVVDEFRQFLLRHLEKPEDVLDLG